MKRLFLLVITMLCPLAIARGQYPYYGPCSCSQAQAQAAYSRAQRGQYDPYAYQRAQAEAYQRAQAAYQRAAADAYQRQQAAAYARTQEYQRARAEAYMRSQAQGGRLATQPQRDASLLPVLIYGGRALVYGGRVVAGAARAVGASRAGQAVREYLRTPEGKREAAEHGYEAVKAISEGRERPEARQPDRQLERAAVRSVPGESSGIRSRVGELAPKVDRSDFGRFAGWGSKGLNDRVGSGQTKDRSRSDSPSKSGNTPSRGKEIKDWQPRG